MAPHPRIFHTNQQNNKAFTLGDVVAIVFIISLLYIGVNLAFKVPSVIKGPTISLSPSALPWYTMLSVGRMLAAYLLSILFTLVYGRLAAFNHRAERILMPLLDVLQSVPILSFLPVVLLSLNAFLPTRIAVELASIILIFTSQAWNLTFSWYQSLTTIPVELREAKSIFRLNSWMSFKYLELPFGMISLVWNSMISWAGGWFFLMAAEMFTVGSRDFRLPGLGAYLDEAANQKNFGAIGWGILALVLTVVILDQVVWRSLIAWSDRFKVEMIENDDPPTSWFLNIISQSQIVRKAGDLLQIMSEAFDRSQLRLFPWKSKPVRKQSRTNWLGISISIIFFGALAYCLYLVGIMLSKIPPTQWGQIGLGLLATFLRVLIALIIALTWTIPLGVAIGTSQKLSKILQPIVQVTASIPATALFPVILLLVLNNSGGLNLAAILLMLMGTQWYLLFNIIAGASAIPQDMKYTTELMHLNGWQRWRILILPAIFPYLVTGAITAGGGAWNASIVAEYHNFGGKTLSVTGIGSLIAQATASGNYPLLLAATLTMILAVVLVNRLFWRRLYKLAEDKYRME